jgi:hypothetical protein
MSHTSWFWSPSGKKFTQNLMHAWCRRKAIAKRMNIPLLVWMGIWIFQYWSGTESEHTSCILVLGMFKIFILAWSRVLGPLSKHSYQHDPDVWSKTDFCMAPGTYKPHIEIGIRPVHSIYPRGWYCLNHSSLVSRFVDTSVNTRCKCK